MSALGVGVIEGGDGLEFPVLATTESDHLEVGPLCCVEHRSTGAAFSPIPKRGYFLLAAQK